MSDSKSKRELSQQTLEDFRIDDVIGELVDIGFVNQYGDVADIGCPRKCHIQLTVTEDGRSKVNANMGQGLAL